MERLLQKITTVIHTIKVPVIVLIFIVALIQVGYSVFIGGQDKRNIITTLIGLMALALLILYAEDLVNWLQRFAR